MICTARQRSASLLYFPQCINNSWYEDSRSLLNWDESTVASSCSFISLFALSARSMASI